MRHKDILILIFIVLAGLGCGRKLPPLPPEESEPVEILSMNISQGEVTATVRCSAPGGDVVLLGKPKGTCPTCTEDLVPRDATVVEYPGTVVLRDRNADSEYMVYRVSLTYGSSQWLTEPLIIRR